MKKYYEAPILELLAFVPDSAIGAWSGESTYQEDDIKSMPWNSGELGWT